VSTHKVEVVKLEKIDPHPNADKMELTQVYGWNCCIGKGQFKSGDLAGYIEPDSLIDVKVPEFGFLAPKAVPEKHGGKVRIKVARLRGIVSQGLIIPARPHWKLGDNVMEELGVEHYEPPLPMSTGGESEKSPPGYRPCYDVEGFYRYRHLFKPGELVVATEKIHGASARYCWAEDRLRAGSRTEWKKYDEKNLWWQAVKSCPWIEEFCKANPDITLYGEAYGQVQKFKYGIKSGARFRAFDLLRGNQWILHQEAREIGKGLEWVPIVYEGPFVEETLKTLAEGPSLVPGADHIREGIVVKPMVERTDPEVGRVQLKIVSNAYLEMD